MPDPIRIALTGGPCGGKTTLLRELCAADPHGERWMGAWLNSPVRALVSATSTPKLGRCQYGINAYSEPNCLPDELIDRW